MYMSDESSAIVEDDMTVDQKIQTKTSGQEGQSSDMVTSLATLISFALPSKNRPGPH